MTSPDERNRFLELMAWVSFAADILTLGQFIFGSVWSQFWTGRWWLSLLFIIGLFWAGMGLFALAGNEEVADFVRGIFGLGYLIAGGIIFVAFCWSTARESLTFADYMGYLVLFFVAQSFGKMALSVVEESFYRLPSYFYALVSLTFTFALIYKYIFTGAAFHLEFFVWEVFLLIVGSMTFLSFFEKSEGRSLFGTG